MADRQAQKRSLPGLSILPPQLAAFYADNPQATGMLQNAQMLNGLALAASWQQGLEAGEQLQIFKPMRPVAQVANQNDGSNAEAGSLPSRLAKRDLMEQAEALAARKRSKSENTLSALEDHGSFHAVSPLARGKRSSGSGRLGSSLEQPGDDEKEMEEEGDGKLDTDDLGQDDREMKRIRRKQSNRESARRSRLRKQRESEALSSSVAGLRQENQQLREANRDLQVKVEELSDQIAQANVGKNVSPRTNLAQKLSAFQVVQKKPSDGSRSTDSHTHSLNPTLGLMPSKETA